MLLASGGSCNVPQPETSFVQSMSRTLRDLALI